MLDQLLHRFGDVVPHVKLKVFVNLKQELTGGIFCYLETICTQIRLHSLQTRGLLSESLTRKAAELLWLLSELHLCPFY